MNSRNIASTSPRRKLIFTVDRSRSTAEVRSHMMMMIGFRVCVCLCSILRVPGCPAVFISLLFVPVCGGVYVYRYRYGLACSTTFLVQRAIICRYFSFSSELPADQQPVLEFSKFFDIRRLCAEKVANLTSNNMNRCDCSAGRDCRELSGQQSDSF